MDPTSSSSPAGAAPDPWRAQAGPVTLPAGMRLRDLPRFEDDRGSLTELARASWVEGHAPRQFNAVRSRAGVLRGLHVHLGYHEFYVVLAGRMLVGFQDTRPGSPSEGQVGVFELCAERPQAVCAPPGIVHGLYFAEAGLLLAGASREWDLGNELGCHWRDPAVRIPWPFEDAVVSARDDAQPGLAEVQARIPAWAP